MINLRLSVTNLQDRCMYLKMLNAKRNIHEYFNNMIYIFSCIFYTTIIYQPLPTFSLKIKTMYKLRRKKIDKLCYIHVIWKQTLTQLDVNSWTIKYCHVNRNVYVMKFDTRKLLGNLHNQQVFDLWTLVGTQINSIINIIMTLVFFYLNFSSHQNNLGIVDIVCFINRSSGEKRIRWYSLAVFLWRKMPRLGSL